MVSYQVAIETEREMKIEVFEDSFESNRHKETNQGYSLLNTTRFINYRRQFRLFIKIFIFVIRHKRNIYKK